MHLHLYLAIGITSKLRSLVGLGAGCAPRQVELRSPACLRLIEGTPQHPQEVRRGCKGLKPQQHTQGRQTGGAFSWVTFFLAKQKKVTSCRATPGDV
jgi:hypothetical protein